MTAVGMIGVGKMGSAMAERLLSAGYEVVVYDLRPDAALACEDKGAVLAATPAELAERCRTVLSSLPGPVEVEALYERTDGLLAGARPGDIHAGLSTVSLQCVHRVAALATASGVRFLDAPVSGGVAGVKAGTLTVLVSGEPAALAATTPVLEAFAGRIMDLGPQPGSATTMKLVNNAIFLCSGLVHQEAIVLAAKAGIEPAVVDDVLGASSAAMYLGLGRHTLSREWDDPFFSLGLAEKDIALALDSARSLAVPMPVVASAHQHYVRAVAAGLSDKSCLATLAAVESAAGIEVDPRPA